MENQTENSSDKPNEDTETIYYGLFLPGECEIIRRKHVYTDKSKAIKEAREYPDGRFKTFKKRSEALEFAVHGNERSVLASPVQAELNAEEKLNNFKTVKSQDLVSFRKLLIAGELTKVEKLIWENPRYIISSCDTPTILQNGCRYNAMHIASKCPEPGKTCELILNTITNKKFLHLIYGEQSEEAYLNNLEILLDRFMNTPDKALNETPLHFAAKHGYKDMVQVLVSYSQCSKTCRNKFNQTPLDIICTRRNQNDNKLKSVISMLLQEQYYVPVLRSVDGTLQPIIGEPFSLGNIPKVNCDPMSPTVEVRAFAGPMPKEKAVEFRKKWKTPPRRHGILSPNTQDNQLESFSTVQSPTLNFISKLQDTEKGLERVGRDLAEECNVSWKEYWPFLSDFADLRNKNDLYKLEDYLKSKMAFPPIFCSGDENKNTKIDLKNTTLDEMYNLCKKFQATRLYDEDSDDDSEVSESNFFTPPSSPIISSDDSSDEDDMCMAEEAPITFIEGEQATKLDYAVYNAIPSEIDPCEFPYICYWRNEMQILVQQNYRFTGKTPSRVKFTMTPEKPIKQFNLKPMKIDFNAE